MSTNTTAQNATQTDALDLSKTQLLGLFGGGDTPRALLRSADGTIVTAMANETTAVGNVIAITDTYVLLRDRNTIRRLMLPA